MFFRKQPSGRCLISDDWNYKDMQVVWMENDLVRIGILIGRGGDIFEFRYKPLDLNFMLRLKKEIHNPQQLVSQIRDTSNQMEDYYYGGWQEVLPNSAAGVYRGAALGQHGELWMIPWKYSIIDHGPAEVKLKLWTRPLRIPLLIEKTLTLKADRSVLIIQEKLTNESGTELDFMWGHHIAFGLPFLKEGGVIETNASQIVAEKFMPAPRRFRAGAESSWPNIVDISGEAMDASLIPPASATPYSELAYLSGFENEAYYRLMTVDKQLGFSVSWDARIFKYLWYWQERYATQDAPWWGSAYAIALEPWTTKHPADPEAAIKRGEYLKIEAGEVIQTKMEAEVIDKNHA